MQYPMVTISQEKYADLLSDSLLLNCLRSCGVDNWEGWDYAIEAYQSAQEED